MQITLNEAEITGAVETYVREIISLNPNQSIDIDFTAGRGPNGMSATIQIKAGSTAKSKTPTYREAQPAKTEAIAEAAAEETAVENGDAAEGEAEPVEEKPAKAPLGFRKRGAVAPEPAPEAEPEVEDEPEQEEAEEEVAEQDEDENEEADETDEAPVTQAPKSVFSRRAS